MSYQLTVAGAGIVGSMTALFAHYYAPSWKIALVDKSTGNQNATSCSAGLILPVKDASIKHSLSWESVKGYNLLTTIIPELNLFALDQVVISRSHSLLKAFPGIVSRPLKPFERQAFFRQQPWIEKRNDRVYTKGAKAAYTYPGEMAAMIRSYLIQKDNISFLPGCEITGYTEYDRFVQLEVQPGHNLLAERVVIAAGPWLWPVSRCVEKIRVKKIVTFLIQMPPNENSPLIFFPEEDSFLLPVHAKKYWVLSIRSSHWNVHPDAVPDVNSDDLQLMDNILSTYAPALKGQPMTAKVFCDGYTTNREPIVTTCSPDSKLVFAGGCSGRGIRLAPGLALSALQKLTTGSLSA